MTKITSDPQIKGGVPCIAGTRMPVSAVLGALRRRDAYDIVRGTYPHLTDEQIETAIVWVQRERACVTWVVKATLVGSSPTGYLTTAGWWSPDRASAARFSRATAHEVARVFGGRVVRVVRRGK